LRHALLRPLLACALFGACSTPTGEAPGAPTVVAGPRLDDADQAARVRAGRALLASGHALEAEALLAAASEADGERLRTRMWLLRAWMELGKSNDTLDALDALDRAGERGLDMTYLYGMAFARRAEGYVADGVMDSSVGMNFIDAVDLLGQALRADPERYADGFLPLAGAAWYVSNPEVARWAAERAVEAQPESVEAWLLRARIALKAYTELASDAAAAPEADALWSQAELSFRRVRELAAAPEDERGAVLLAAAAREHGDTFAWKQRGAEATEAYGTAAAWDPAGFPYRQAYDALRGLKAELEDERPFGFRAALELAHAELVARGKEAAPEAGNLLWWLGWARFVAADWTGSEQAFAAALALGPEYANAWFYVGLARQYRQDSEGALAAMHAGWDADPAAMVAVAASAGGALRAFENLLGWCASQETPRNLDAAFLAEMLAQAFPTEPRHWNNLGLFLRDEGERLELEAFQAKLPEPDAAVTDPLYERALAAYERALELSPDDPQLLNDTALMLIYHVGPDFPRAQTMFERAIALIGEHLADPALGPEDRQRFEQSKTDAEENLQRVRDHLAGKDATPEDGAAADDSKTAEAAATGGG
jgi:hypothetical protein